MNNPIAKWAILLLTLCCAACDGRPSPLYIDSLLARGKAQLGEGAWAPARASFEEALVLDPQNVEAQYGFVLSELRHFWGILDFASQISGDILKAPGLKGSSSAFQADDRGSLDAWLGQQIVDFDATMADLIERTERLRNNPAARIRLAHYPFQIKGKTYLDFGGEWDRSDAYVLDALFVSIAAVTRTLRSQELALGVSPLYSDYVALGQSFTPNALGAMLARNLEREPKWLTLTVATEQDPGGAVHWIEAGDLWLRAAEDLRQLPTAIQAETDNQSDDIFRMEPENGKDFLLQQPATDRKPARFLWEGTTVSLKATLERIATNLKEPGAPRIRLAEDGLLVGIVVLDALRQSMDLAAFIGEFGIELPDVVGDFLSLPSSSGEGFANGILGVAGDYVPGNLVELDLGGFYRNPVDLRRLLPVWRVTSDGAHDGFVWSYECPRMEATGSLTDGGEVRFSILDTARSVTPGAGNDSLALAFATFGAGATDAENFLLTEDPSAEGWFDGTLLPTAGTVTLFDDILELNGNPVTTTATFVDTAAEPAAAFTLRWVNGARTDSLPDAEGFACESATRDATHFKESIFANTTWLDGNAVRKGYPPAAPDGIYGKLPYLPLGSPSLNGLLYIDPVSLTSLKPLKDWAPKNFGFQDAMRLGDVRSINALIQAYGALLGE